MNLTCGHCYKGSSQGINITQEVSDTVFNTFRKIETIDTFGGEMQIDASCVDTFASHWKNSTSTLDILVPSQMELIATLIFLKSLVI